MLLYFFTEQCKFRYTTIDNKILLQNSSANIFFIDIEKGQTRVPDKEEAGAFKLV